MVNYISPRFFELPLTTSIARLDMETANGSTEKDTSSKQPTIFKGNSLKQYDYSSSIQGNKHGEQHSTACELD